jgi:predicted aminopeptidase
MIEVERFHELAGHFEFDEGHSRFQAETRAAERMGVKRWEAINAIRNGNSEEARDHRKAPRGNAANNLPGVQSHPAEQNRPMPKRHIQA